MIRQAPSGVAAFIDRFGTGPVGEAVQISGTDEFEEVFGPLEHSTAGIAVAQFFENGGEHAWVGRADPEPGATLLQALQGALETLGAVGFDLLCVPAAATLDEPDAAAHTPNLVAFAQDAIRLCTQRRAIWLLDPPPWLRDAAAMAAWVRANPLDSPDAAVWFPRLLRPPEGTGTGAAGAVAGMIARTDRERGVWSAPAGLRAELVGVRTALELTQQDVSLLNQLGVNSVMNHRGGPVSWGARTMAGRDELGSEWKYLPVRRLALHIESSLRQGLHWHVDEDNAPALWARLRGETAGFLDGLFRAGAFQGRSADEAYFVSCDADTITATDLEAGRVHVVVGFSPLRPAEFQVLDIELRRADRAAVADAPEAAVASPSMGLRRREEG
ncbi:hypothetical protein GCM10028820_28060 [Tessaracoccus terricola]